MAGLGALRRLLRLAKEGNVPVDEIREVGRQFAARDPEEYFQRYSSPAESVDAARRQYGVTVAPPEAGDRADLRFLRDETPFLISGREPEFLKRKALKNEGPGVARLLDEWLPASATNRLYEIDSISGITGHPRGVGVHLYPAIFDVLSGGREMYNVPTALTKVNERRRSMQMADALMRNPKLENRLLPHDTQLDAVGMSPMYYMQAPREEKIGALALSHAMKNTELLDALVNDVSPSVVMSAHEALRLPASASPSAFNEIVGKMDPLVHARGLGAGALRRAALVDAILSGSRLHPDAWTGVARKAGGLMRGRKPPKQSCTCERGPR